MRNTKSIYIHIPFCIKKCLYCDFSSEKYNPELSKPYINALKEEIRLSEKSSCEIETIYFGGGTPSILNQDGIKDVLEEVYKNFAVSRNAEITLEANPATADFEKLKDLNELGINRLSIGIQSFSDRILELLGRVHTKKQAIELYENARRAGFENISLDLMFALPNQSLSDLMESLNTAVNLNPEHISIYELSFEENTPFGKNEKILKEAIYPDPSEMTDLIEDTLFKNGYIHYEISNFAKEGFRSKHNQTYWNNEEYYGFGVSSVDFDGTVRKKKTDNIDNYISCLLSDKKQEIVSSLPKDTALNSVSNFTQDLSSKKTFGFIDFQETLSYKERAFETIMLGLRMTEGFDFKNAAKNLSPEEKENLYEKIKSMPDMLIMDGDILKTTSKGARFLNDILIELI